LVSGEEPAEAPIVHQFLNDPEETPEPDLLTDILLPLQREDVQ
jgi:DNA gyrase inhibitor GyrI